MNSGMFEITKESREIYNKGIQNRFSLEVGEISYSTNVKRILYYLFVSILSPNRSIDLKEIFFINGKSQRKFILPLSGVQKVYRGFGDKIWKCLREDYYMTTPISRFSRLKLFVTAIRTYKKSSEKDKFCLWLDYLTINAFIKMTRPSAIISRGHTDEYTTWLGELALTYRYRFDVYQHGVMGCSNTAFIPNKIYYSRFYAFDNYSIEIFKEHFIRNDTCECMVYNFPPSVLFDTIVRDDDTVYIGIGEQLNETWVKQIVDELQNISLKKKIYLMKHPLSNIDYSELSRVIEETNKKYDNLDYFITENSTLALDYYRNGGKVKVIYTDSLAKGCFRDYNFFYLNEIGNLHTLI